MAKFKVGDIIRAIDDRYNMTSEYYKYEGKVIKVNGPKIVAITTKSTQESDIGTKYTVEANHFELVKPRTFRETFENIKL